VVADPHPASVRRAQRRRGTARRLARALALASAVPACALSLALPSSAGALVESIPGTSVGLQPRETEAVFDGTLSTNELGESSVTEGAALANESGNAVVHASNVYAVYWDPTFHYHNDWKRLIDTFLQGVGANSGSLGNVFAVDAQYTDKTNQPAAYGVTFRGAYTDTNAYPSATCTNPKAAHADEITCVTDAQIRAQLETFVAQHGLERGMSSIFYLLTPPGVTVCLDNGGGTGHCSDSEAAPSTSYSNSFCSYHSDINPGAPASGSASTLLYAVIPWSAGGLGDGHLIEHPSGIACQDGGFDPSSEPPEEKESSPLQQEPNQVGCPSEDGSCDTGLADLIINQIAVEQQNAVTDPLLNAWQDPSHNEVTDECRNFFAGGTIQGSATENAQSKAGTLSNQDIAGRLYYLNNAYNLAATKLAFPGVPCVGGVTLEPHFTAPNAVNSGELVAFDGGESDVSLAAATGFSAGGAPQSNYATYTWDFGDGTPTVSGYAPGSPVCGASWLSPCAESAFHSYQYGGTYTVRLTITDVASNSASFTQAVTVNGPGPPPAAEVPTGTGASSAAASSVSSQSSQSGGASASPSATKAKPIVNALAVSRSLRRVMRRGLVVRYRVNERVAGHLEVLLASSVARRLGLHGRRATGLARGTPPHIVIGKALLVTTRGGHNRLKIRLSRRTARRLARLHSVSLLVRVLVRNQQAETTTVVQAIKLRR
jgi:PKD domain